MIRRPIHNCEPATIAGSLFDRFKVERDGQYANSDV
jgi:hypothetical protein